MYIVIFSYPLHDCLALFSINLVFKQYFKAWGCFITDIDIILYFKLCIKVFIPTIATKSLVKNRYYFCSCNTTFGANPNLGPVFRKVVILNQMYLF